ESGRVNAADDHLARRLRDGVRGAELGNDQVRDALITERNVELTAHACRRAVRKRGCVWSGVSCVICVSVDAAVATAARLVVVDHAREGAAHALAYALRVRRIVRHRARHEHLRARGRARLVRSTALGADEAAAEVLNRSLERVTVRPPFDALEEERIEL